MARRSSNFMIGLFVTVGVVIAVSAVVWLGASKYFEEGSLYATYFDESVQGLQVDSRVKYRGVDIGKVQSIGVAPDRRLVEVVMKIDLDRETVQNVVTQLRAAGITGIVFIELDRQAADDPVLTPPKEMKTRHPVIPSQLSQTKQMLSSVDRIMSRIGQVDLQGISGQIIQTSRTLEAFLTGKQMTGMVAKLDSAAGSIERTSQAVETFLTGKQMTGMVAKLDSTADSLERGVQRIDRILEKGEAEGILEEARQGLQESRKAISDLRGLVALVREEVKGLKAGETADRAGRLIEAIDRRTRAIKTDFERTTDEVRQALESLKLLVDRLQQNPSDLIFSRPDLNEGPQMGEVKR